MKAVTRTLGALIPMLVIGAIIFFIYYSLIIFKPNGTIACQKTAFARQVDVAANVVRDWFGKGQMLYNACPK